jgi:hypothetical protein
LSRIDVVDCTVVLKPVTAPGATCIVVKVTLAVTDLLPEMSLADTAQLYKVFGFKPVRRTDRSLVEPNTAGADCGVQK